MTEADKIVFLDSIEQKEFEPEFTSKKWAYTIDQQSVAGNYNSMLSFNIGNLASSGLWCDLRESIVRFPISLTIKDTGSVNHSLAALDSMAASIKGSFYSLVNSMQFTVGSTTLQSHMPYLNTAVHFDMMTKFATEEAQKWRDPLAFGLDDCSLTKDSVNFEGLANAVATAKVPAQGFVLDGTKNKAFQDRVQSLNNSKTATTLKTAINPNATTQGEGGFAALAALSSGVRANSQIIWAATYMATLRLKDLCPALREMPAMKNARGFCYIAYQSATSTITYDDSFVLTGCSNSTRFGNTQPMLLGTIPAPTVKGTTLVCTCDVSGATVTLADGTTSVSPAFAAARLYAPLIEATPEVDRALSLQKVIRYTDRILTTVDLAKGTSISSVVSAGVVNPKRVTILPLISGNGSTDLTFANPAELSPFEAAPMTSSPFAALKNINILVGGKPVVQTPTLYSFENYQHEIANEMGVFGGQNEVQSSGILTGRQWENLYRYYTYNLARRLQSQDGSAVSITLSCSNDSEVPLRLLVWVEYERECRVDTAIGDVKQNF